MKETLSQNVQSFMKTEAGSHLLMLMLEDTLAGALKSVRPLERMQFEEEYGCTSSVEMDFGLLLTHLSRIRVVADLNNHAEDCLANYRASDDGTVFLADARRYVVDALRIVPKEHPERARGYKNLAYLLLARNKAKGACDWIDKALTIFQLHGLVEPIEELLEMLSTRTEEDCKLMQENAVAVLRKMEVELS